MLGGTGAHGAYHAGVLRALHEAGVKIDVLAGQGIGAGSAALAAIDGSARLWEENGVWDSPRISALYRWNRWLRSAAVGGGAILSSLAVVLLLRMLAPQAVSILNAAIAFGIVALLAAAALVLAWRRVPGVTVRRARGSWWWRLLGAPLDASSARELFTGAIRDLVPGSVPGPHEGTDALGRRYSEALHENLGHPGFGELLLVATDLDARRDTVAALLREPYRAEFFGPRPDRDRRSEVLDLAGAARDHAIDMVSAALTPPLLCEPQLVTFAADSFWRGETHRLCDRPGSMHRLLEETAATGASQAIVVSAVSSAAAPHRLRVPRLDLRSRLGELQSGAESASLRDALEMARLRFDSIYVISPAHNPIGPFDFVGAYDEASDRHQDLQELMQCGYEDAYRQFIEPVVGASGDQLARVGIPAPPAYTGRDTVFDDPALPD